jgi:hypothetical protein
MAVAYPFCTFGCHYRPMSRREMGEDDERDLINAEFESMVAHLSLDESAPTTYLDELEKREPLPEYAKAPRVKFNLRKSLKSWWNRLGRDDDGAVV